MKRPWTVCLAWTVATLALRAVATPSDAGAVFETANKLYEEGRFQEAIDRYQPLLTNHPSLAVHFNLGNAYFKSGQLGNAIAEYRQARQLAPRDPDVQANLRFARARVAGPSYVPGWIQQKARLLTLREWRTIATVAVWAFFGLLIVRELQPRWRPGLRAWAVGIGILALTAVVWVVGFTRTLATARIAVVTQREVVMRLGPFEESQSALTLKDGAELRVLDEKADWLQVTPGNEVVGWVPATAVEQTNG